MKNIFVYGSLMYPEVWGRLIKRHYPREDATLSGYRRLRVKGETYPGLIRSNGSHVRGVVYHGVKHQDLILLDRFEGRLYKRIPVNVDVAGQEPLRAEVYLFRPSQRRRLVNSDWDREIFNLRDLRRFLSAYSGF